MANLATARFRKRRVVFSSTPADHFLERVGKMANPWFRFYHEFEDDPKVAMMPEPMQLRLVKVFCGRCKGGKITDQQRAFKWHISTTELAATKKMLLDGGFIDEEWNPIAWDRRQFLSDSSTDRVRRFRQGKKQDETLHETKRNVTVTAPEQNRTDTEQKKPSPTAARRRAKKKRASPPTKTDIVNSRHTEFKVAIFEYWKSKNPDLDCPWAQPEGMQLEMWLKASPNVTLAQFKDMLRNRYRSPVNHANRPSQWLRNVSSWANGLADDYGKLVNGGNGHANGKLDRAAQAIRDAEDLFGRSEEAGIGLVR